MDNKKIFYISVIGEQESLNRAYSDGILALINRKSNFCEQYIIERNDDTSMEDLYESLSEAVIGNKYEGYIILLDCLDDSNGICNPNVMFEFGAIKNLNKPFVVIGSHKPEKYPFDIKGLNVESIPEIITDYIKTCNNNEETVGNIVKHFFGNDVGGKQDKILTFLERVYDKYIVSLNKHKQEGKRVTHNEIMDEIKEIKDIVKGIGNTAEYIDGEPAAFNAVREAVQNAKYSLRTSRFANQSIVIPNATKEQNEFMFALYNASKRLKRYSHRIICNNSPLKWLDIYNALFYGGNESKVYIRKNEFSIHFELVVIDESVAFIHFYQPDHAEGKDFDSYDHEIEKINSTLKIQGNSICHKLSNIFNRLHHKDFNQSIPHDPSRTLLGIPAEDVINERYVNNGCFSLPNNVPEHIEYMSNNDEKKRKDAILNMFKQAFKTWPISDKYDKQNMLVGIALLERSDDFICKMLAEKIIEDGEALIAKKIFDQQLNFIQ